MTKVLIISMRDDAHVRAVTWGLQELGLEPVVWYWSEFPKNDSAALRLGGQGRQTTTLAINDAKYSGPFDVIWVRRRDDPAPMSGTHPDDQEVVVSETNRFFDNILLRLGHPGTRWVNHPYADHRCRNKATQLLTAQGLGFRIPDTLIGNDIHEVRGFFASHPQGVVHKAFFPLKWENEDGSRTTARTSLITSAHLAGEFAVRACPGIYQEKIEKQYELRITVMGDTVLASRIDSQRDGPTIDWRCEGGRGKCNLSVTRITPELAQLCRAMCRELGLAFGCIDLIVTPSGETVFLEINCAGQFLFNEISDPRMPVLDAFCRYLAAGTADGAGSSTGRLSMERFHAWLRSQQPGSERTVAAGVA